ncbi:hypothetical protein [Lutibacter sp.]|uniref:hypothetical protein n=1 Tax=Lutibacter sp. TaxID=1925666 RepID=UPI00356255B7
MRILYFILILTFLNVKAQERVLISETDSINIYETYLSTNTTNNIFPTKYKNGLLYLSSHKSTSSHLFYSNLNSKSKKIKIDKKFQSGAVNVFKNEIYVTATSKNMDSFGFFNLAIYQGIIEDLKVSNFSVLPICKNEFSYADPTISNDGNLMVIVTNENGRYHLLELKRTVNNEWERGSVIYISHPNFKILNPTIYDENTIYFSSNIYNGELTSVVYENIDGNLKMVEKKIETGVFNIYKIERNNGTWGIPIKTNEFNSEFDELGVLFTTKSSGYLTTYRFNNNDNIYYFELK